MKTHRAVIDGCGNETLIREAKAAGRKWRNNVLRGDLTAEQAFNESGVGYPYMSQPDYTAAKAAFVNALKGTK
jgi:hypothetical protein